jgi:hypothetical protein
MADRSVAAVPRLVLALLALTFSAQIAIQANRPAPAARAEALPEPATPALLRLASLNEPIAAAQLLTLYLQAFDNQPGISVPFRDLDYPRVIGWLETILDLDAIGQYPLMMASQLYAQVPIEAKQRLMLDFVYRKFREDPQRRWRWLAHATIVAKHRLKDNALALRYADDIARLAQGAPSWARQMRIFILEDMGEPESAAVLLGALLATGEIDDRNEIHFLMQRLEQMKKSAEKSAPASKN